ncbi:MAG: 5-formyltetrahydrofolate cyclo-ligase [Gammaproteobacteria bacterium]|nr:5-formyltetrahydrofolate cyclo-ligase [Gammaproteobacteria bacterium]
MVKRRSVTEAQKKAAGQAAKKLLIAHPLFQRSQHVACYFGQQDEFDCNPIIQEIWRLEKKCYLPALSTQEKCLDFIVYQSDDPLRLNFYNIPEPENNEKIAADKLNLVIVPLIAFDLQLHRLGMGGGYYDRTFAFKQKGKTYNDKPYLLGLGYELQHVSVLPTDPWDVLLDGILTEEKLLGGER